MKNPLEIVTIYIDNLGQKKNFKFLREILNNELNCVFDIGCHKGETITFFNKFFKIKKIFAFDINENSLKTIQKKKMENVILINKGLSDKKKKIQYKTNFFSPSNSLCEENVDSSHSKFKKKILKIFFFYKKNATSLCSTDLITLDSFIKENKLTSIDILKIDAEGYEFKILKGLKNNIHETKVILFEHHYDNSLIKNYKFSDINKFLKKNNFKKVYKNKMFFRKIFEYVYINRLHLK